MPYRSGDIEEEVPRKLSELPEHTQTFLRELREEEVEELQEAIRFMRSVKTVGTFFKWVLISFVGFVVGVVTFGEQVMKIRYWFKQNKETYS